MAFSFQTRTIRNSVFLFMALTLSLSDAAVRHISSAAVNDSKVETNTITTKPKPQSQNESVRTIRVFIHPEDIYPSAAHVKPGKLRLVAENETQTDVSLIVERVSPGQSQRVGAVKTVNHAKRSPQEITLGAGEYVFYEESRPQQKGRIIVDPHDR